jgi:hypothetical protein
MTRKTEHVSLDELYILHGYSAGAAQAAGLRGAVLDQAIAATLSPLLEIVECSRATQAAQRTRLSIVRAAPADE